MSTDATDTNTAPQPEAPDVAQMSAAERLRAFEDRIIGPEAARPYGRIETGIGSPFSLLGPADRAHHAALERLIAAEAELSASTKVHAAAQEKHATAMQHVASTATQLIIEAA